MAGGEANMTREIVVVEDEPAALRLVSYTLGSEVYAKPVTLEELAEAVRALLAQWEEQRV